jgi:hypothetical protein
MDMVVSGAGGLEARGRLVVASDKSAGPLVAGVHVLTEAASASGRKSNPGTTRYSARLSAEPTAVERTSWQVTSTFPLSCPLRWHAQ